MVKRYDEGGYGLSNMEESADGSWVDYEAHLMVVMGMEQLFNDKVAALQQERDALAAEVSAIREQAEGVYAAGYNHGHLNTVDGIAYSPGTKDEFYHHALQVMLEVETPATDTFLSAVRAEGVEIFATFKRQQEGKARFGSTEKALLMAQADEAFQYAAQLLAPKGDSNAE